MIALLIMLLGTAGCRLAPAADTKALPVDQWLQANGGTVLLTGPWDFYWNALLSPTDSLPEDVSQLAMGRIWNGFVQSTGRVTPSQGSATYRYVLRDLPPHADGYSLTFRYALTSYRAYIFPEGRPEEARVVTSGIVSLTKEGAVPSRKWNSVAFGSDRIENWVVLVQVSNHHHELGGFREAPFLSLGNSYQRNFELQQIGTFICLGAMASIAFYSLMLHLRRRTDQAALMLACVASLVILRVIFYNPILYQYFSDTKPFFKIQLQIDFISASLAVSFYILFLNSSLTAKLHEWVYRTLVLFNVFYVGFVLAASIEAVTLYRPMLLASLVVNVGLGAYLLFKSLYQRADGVSYIFAGTLAAFLALVHDTLIPQGIVSSTHIIQYGLTIFLIIHSQLVVRRSAQSFAEAESLAAALNIKNAEIEAFNENLQSMVDFKSREVRTILDHIPQGVLLIGKDAKVTGDYSANLIELIGTRDIAGQSVMDLIFQYSDLDSDRRDRLLHSLRAAIGTRRLSFDVNVDNLPKAFTLQIGDRIQHIKATWTVLTSRRGQVEFILLTLLDVTSELRAAREHETKLREFEIVRQLLMIEPMDAVRFFESSGALLQKSRRLLILLGETPDQAIIKELFMHAHTVKGSARTLNLMDLANALHQAEDTYQEFMQQSGKVDRGRLWNAFHAVLESFEQHEAINFHQLNRSRQGKSQAWTPPQSSLSSLLDRFQQHALHLAQDLGRDPPNFVFEVIEAPLSESLLAVLDQCMIHIVSNALVHGIEASEERQRAGKDPRGTLRISSFLDGRNFVLQVSDDGRGLALKEIFAAGLKAGVLHEQSSEDEILESLFKSGVSTAVEVSLHAGRGIGLDAVRAYILQIGGAVTIRLDKEPGFDDGRRPFTLELRIPFAVRDAG
ncbi:MAG TPA: 7TM diverse intracellular signaling domain-containing protein [Oligoflexus sp.]|uniref:7TM diverse intracellular signaling domain-containing protein n=1 Tax=Oligoflexus sp. TaxID=1971216 RepID=UPI002D7EF2A7|nr:7TM diverse intracellular signaling domain-containing protein [Oligoflexus sp.]HET9238976.1 7TM diverse intracellular signaling domain-containing protein [Oligoflexus sp.]